MATLAGLIATGAAFTGLSYRLNRESHELDRQGQITERFTRAIDQLGSNTLDVRLGRIYALERIAEDSPEDHPQVIEVLTAYVREHTPWPPRPGDTTKADERTTLKDSAGIASTNLSRRQTLTRS